jgi:hypothetical protein
MAQPTLNTTPLFQTSLRDWQASWKASRGQDRTAPGAVAARLGRLSRRVPRPTAARQRV